MPPCHKCLGPCTCAGTLPTNPFWAIQMYPITRTKSLKELLEEETSLMEQIAQNKHSLEILEQEYKYKVERDKAFIEHSRKQLKECRDKLRTYFTDKELENLLNGKED